MARFDMSLQASGSSVIRSLGETMMEQGLRFAAGSQEPLDLVKAHACFNLADREGIEGAAYQRQTVAAEMTKAELAAALRQARALIASLA